MMLPSSYLDFIISLLILFAFIYIINLLNVARVEIYTKKQEWQKALKYLSSFIIFKKRNHCYINMHIYLYFEAQKNFVGYKKLKNKKFDINKLDEGLISILFSCIIFKNYNAFNKYYSKIKHHSKKNVKCVKNAEFLIEGLYNFVNGNYEMAYRYFQNDISSEIATFQFLIYYFRSEVMKTNYDYYEYEKSIRVAKKQKSLYTKILGV